MKPIKKVLIAGGGTGGHIFPAIAMADAFRARFPDVEILFVGASGGMEIEKVPRAGYKIETVWISGLYRQINLKNIGRNLLFPIKYIASNVQAQNIVRRFNPQIAIGVGGYAAYPALNAAVGQKNILTVVQEQNAFPGLVNRRLAPLVDAVLLGAAEAEDRLKAKKAFYIGNPIRTSILGKDPVASKLKFGFSLDKPVLFVSGGSLGARTLNQALLAHYEKVIAQGGQILWQCGKIYYDTLKMQIKNLSGLILQPFIEEMGEAYAAADLVLARAGALTLAEIAALAKPSVLVPSPNVAEDHQTHNARAYSNRHAALTIADSALSARFEAEVTPLLFSDAHRAELSHCLAPFAKTNVANEAVAIIVNLYEKKYGLGGA